MEAFLSCKMINFSLDKKFFHFFVSFFTGLYNIHMNGFVGLRFSSPKPVVKLYICPYSCMSQILVVLNQKDEALVNKPLNISIKSLFLCDLPNVIRKLKEFLCKKDEESLRRAQGEGGFLRTAALFIIYFFHIGFFFSCCKSFYHFSSFINFSFHYNKGTAPIKRIRRKNK